MANNSYTSLNPQQKAKPRKRISGAAMMVRGAILAGIGIVISLISYAFASSAADSGGTGYYTVFYGMIVVGVIYLIVGFFRMLAGK
jgi:hypothetical protein